MDPACRLILILMGVLAVGDESETLEMTPAVACREIRGYEDYEPLPDAALTAEEKLLVYYRASGFRTQTKGKENVAHLYQDGRIRRRGQKAVLQSKDKMIDFETRSERPIESLYLKTAVSLKGLKPGEYEFDIILHDANGKGPEATATQSLKFRVIPVAEVAPANAEAKPDSDH